MSSKLWTFGDSFTAGAPLTYNKELAKEYGVSSETIWPALLANKLNLELHNYGKDSKGNDYIINCLCKNLYKIDKGDFVVIGLSSPFRLDVYDWINDKEVGITPGVIMSLVEKRQLNNPNLFESKSVLGGDAEGALLREATAKYFTLIRSKGERFHRQRDTKTVIGIQKELYRRDINSIIWDWSVDNSNNKWGIEYLFPDSSNKKGIIQPRFYSFRKDYDAIPKDGHWTAKGHKQFYDKIYKEISNNNNHWEQIY